MPIVSLLIADDMGLGKTIECGMVELEPHEVQERPLHEYS
jgi:hypothetical protein